MKKTPNGPTSAGQDQAGIAVVQVQLGEQAVLRQDHRLFGIARPSSTRTNKVRRNGKSSRAKP